MIEFRLGPLSIAALALAVAAPAPAGAQDFFDWLNGAPPKKKEETYKGEVPEPVQRDTLPDLAPAPVDAGAPPTDRRVDETGEPIPRGPDGAAYDAAGNPASAQGAEPQDEQFDPLQARRNGYRQAAPPAPAPAPRAAEPLPWQNPDRTAPPRQQGERWAPGTYEDDQSRPDDPQVDDPQDSDEGAGPYYNNPPPGRPGPRSDAGQREIQQGFNQNPRDPGGWQDRDTPRYSPPGAGQGPLQGDSWNRPGAPNGPDPWQSMSIADLESTLAAIDLPSRSPVIHELWLRLVTTRSSQTDARLAAIRADALNRTGMTHEAANVLAQAGDVSSDPVMATLAARTAIGAGQRDQARTDHEEGGDDREPAIERRPQRRLLRPDALGVEARGAETNPVEESRLDGDAGRIGERESAVFLGPQEFRDEEPDREIDEEATGEGEKDGHGLIGCAGSTERSRQAPLRRGRPADRCLVEAHRRGRGAQAGSRRTGGA